jgi:MSHA pilin protein MshC
MCPKSVKNRAIKLEVHLQRGFTMVELIAVMVIVGIIAAVAAPRFMSVDAFKSRGFRDQVISTLRYAQKAAIAQHRFVCVAFTSSSVTLTYGLTSACASGTLTGPTGPYVLSSPSSNVSLGGYTPFSFDAIGKPSVANSAITITSETSIAVEAETGYVH